MSETSVESLSDTALVDRVASLCLRQSQGNAEIICCLLEVEQRQIHLKQAYSSMYDYCLRRLRMSDGTANRRLTAARLVRRFPQLLALIARGDIHLTGLALLRDHLTAQNCDELLAAVSRKTSRQIEAILVCRTPKPDVPTSVIPIDESTQSKQGAAGHSVSSRSRISPLSPSRFEVRFTVSLETREKLDRAQALMRHRNASGDLGVVVDRALDALLATLEKERLGKSKRPRASRGTKQGSISNASRREVFERDGEQCTYQDEDGNRCPARGFLELDHVDARARGGSDEPTNLRVRCGPHNRLHAEATFGRAHVARSIDLRRRRQRGVDVEATADVDAPDAASTSAFDASASASDVDIPAAKPELGLELATAPDDSADAPTNDDDASALETDAEAPVESIPETDDASALVPDPTAPPDGNATSALAPNAAAPSHAGLRSSAPGPGVAAALPLLSENARALQGLRSLGFETREASFALYVVLRRRKLLGLASPLPEVLRDAIIALTSTRDSRTEALSKREVDVAGGAPALLRSAVDR